MQGFAVKVFKTSVKNYLDNSSIHGLRYLAEKGRMIWERVFWLSAVIASCYGTLLLTKSSYDDYNDHPISFATETDYLHWNTNFPAVSVCEKDNQNMFIVEEYVKKVYPDKTYDYDFHGFVYNIVYSTGQCEECKVYCREHPDACHLDFKKTMFDVRLPCDQLLKDCRWNKKSFNCCSKFIPVESEKGLCLAANTIHTVNRLPLMISNKDTGPGILEFKVTRFSEILIHGRDDVPFLSIKPEQTMQLPRPSQCKLLFTVKEIENDALLLYENLSRRDCRFPHENSLIFFPYYSYSTCVTECRAIHQKIFCNCTHHMIPNTEMTSCNSSGLACVYDRTDLLAFRTKGYKLKKGIECDCNTSCVEPELNVVYSHCEDVEGMEGSVGDVTIQMVSLPTERFKRNLIESDLDLVVSVGGTVGLFLGASLLSGVEIIIYFCLRPLSNKY